VPADLRRLARTGALAGVVVFARNIAEPAQWAALVDELGALFPSGPPPIVAVDQEGGAVQRLKPPALPEATPVPAMGELGERLDALGFEDLGAAMGAELRALGCNVDFAPVLDVDTNPDNPVIGTRAFGKTPAEVIGRGLAFARGLADSGIAWCGKHFPGHGDTQLDSHLALPRLTTDLVRLRAIELAPFAAAAKVGAPLIMSAHVVFSALDAEYPATLSPAVIPPLLRGEMRYEGVVISDDLDMLAVRDHFTVSEIARGLAAADVDLALVCRDLDFAHELASALPSSPTAELRIMALRQGLARPRLTPLPPFPTALRARLLPTPA